MFKKYRGAGLGQCRSSTTFPYRLALWLLLTHIVSPIVIAPFGFMDSIWAQNQERPQDEILVTAPKGGKSSGSSGERISLHDTENKTANKISDIIEKQRGAKVTRYGAPGTFSTLSIRGANPNQTGVYIDGFPLNDTSGAASKPGKPAFRIIPIP